MTNLPPVSKPKRPSPVLSIPFRQPRNPWTPVDILSPDQVEQLHNASMEILEDTGIDFLDDETLTIWEKAGAKVDRAARHVWIDRGLIESAVASAPAEFDWYARNPAHNLHIGRDTLTFGPCGGMVYASSLEEARHPGTLADYENFLRLTQMAPVIHFGPWEQVTPQDIEVSVRHLQRLRSGILLTDKVLLEAAHGRIISADNIALAKIAFGADSPPGPIVGDVINVNSPLRYDKRMLGGLITYARAGQATMITPFILAGATSPITMAAALAQQNAETLAGVALTQIVNPGAPVLYGGFTVDMDMRSGNPAFGTPTGAWAALAGAQLARRYKLPYRGGGGLTNSHLPDAQAVQESQWMLWSAIMGHANVLMHSAGWLEAGLTASFEKFILDVESLAVFHDFFNGFEINTETLALDMIAQVGPGGHNLGTPHTAKRFRHAFYESTINTRQNNKSWLDAGGLDATQRAYVIWKQWLMEYTPPPLDPAIREAVEDFVARRSKELENVELYND